MSRATIAAPSPSSMPNNSAARCSISSPSFSTKTSPRRRRSVAAPDGLARRTSKRLSARDSGGIDEPRSRKSVQGRVARHTVAALRGTRQDFAEIAPAISDGFDRLPADRDLAMHDHLAAEPLIEKTAGIGAHHPDQRGRMAGIHESPE